MVKVRKLEEKSEIKSDDKAVRQIRMRHSDFADRNLDPFLRYLALCNDLGPIHYLTKILILQESLLILLTSALSLEIYMICWSVKD